MSYSDAEKLHEVERELQMRKRFYPSMIAKGSLSEQSAQRQCAILREIAEDYRERIRQEPASGAVFSP